MKTFIIFGYGTPKDILQDENYGRYLSVVFNCIYDAAVDEPVKIIFTGGPTDCFRPPFKRTEAGEMSRLFKTIAGRVSVKAATKKWKYILEQKSVAGIENHLYSRKHIKKSDQIVIFCEYTRAGRNLIIAKKVFKGFKVAVVGIDFDMSSNRYLDKKFLRNKERKTLEVELGVIKSPAKLKEYIGWHKNKLDFLRENYKKNHAKMVEKWWKNNIKNNF